VAVATDRIAAVVFDLDGVLVESEHLWEENWRAFAASRGATWEAADTARLQGMSVPEWSADLAGRTGDGDPAAVAEAVIDGMVRALGDGRIALLPGAAAMVGAAAGMEVVAIPNPTYPPRPDALARCAKIAPSPDEVRRYLVERLPAPAAAGPAGGAALPG